MTWLTISFKPVVIEMLPWWLWLVTWHIMLRALSLSEMFRAGEMSVFGVHIYVSNLRLSSWLAVDLATLLMALDWWLTIVSFWQAFSDSWDECSEIGPQPLELCTDGEVSGELLVLISLRLWISSNVACFTAFGCRPIRLPEIILFHQK